MRCLVNIVFFFSIIFILPVSANDKNNTLIEYFKNDFIVFMSSDWSEYSLREFFTKKPQNFDYITRAFGEIIINKSLDIRDININIEEKTDLEGGYDLAIVVLKYDSENTAKGIYKLIANSKTKNLKGGKIFIAYTSKLCGRHIVLFSSRAILTNKIKAYFKYINTVTCDPINALNKNIDFAEMRDNSK